MTGTWRSIVLLLVAAVLGGASLAFYRADHPPQMNDGNASTIRSLPADVGDGTGEFAPRSSVIDLGHGPARILGRVLDEDDRPVRRLALAIAYGAPKGQFGDVSDVSGNAANPRSYRAVVTSDDDGRFDVRGLFVGNHFISPGSGQHYVLAGDFPAMRCRSTIEITHVHVLTRRLYVGAIKGQVICGAGERHDIAEVALSVRTPQSLESLPFSFSPVIKVVEKRLRLRESLGSEVALRFYRAARGYESIGDRVVDQSVTSGSGGSRSTTGTIRFVPVDRFRIENILSTRIATPNCRGHEDFRIRSTSDIELAGVDTGLRFGPRRRIGEWLEFRAPVGRYRIEAGDNYHAGGHGVDQMIEVGKSASFSRSDDALDSGRLKIRIVDSIGNPTDQYLIVLRSKERSALLTTIFGPCFEDPVITEICRSGSYDVELHDVSGVLLETKTVSVDRQSTAILEMCAGVDS